MTEIRLNNAAILLLGSNNTDVDRYIKKLATTAYNISQQLVPTKGQPDDPYARGPLKESGKVKRGPGTSTWDVEYGTRHAIYVELGTRHMKAEPFLRPALLAAVRSRGN